MSIEYAPELY